MIFTYLNKNIKAEKVGVSKACLGVAVLEA